MKKVFQNPEGAPAPAGAYSQVVRVETGDTALLYISGQVAVDLEGQVVGKGDVAAQAEQVFKNLGAILTANGATFADVIKLNYYLLDIAHRPALAEVRGQIDLAQFGRPELLAGCPEIKIGGEDERRQ